MFTGGRRGRTLACAAVVALATSVHAQVAHAAPDVPVAALAAPTPPQTVSADALPTVQINGVVWKQVIVGNTVYAGGQFTNARPAGAAPGVNTTPRANLLAYNLQTGQLITTFAPSLNAKVNDMAVTPDGSKLVVVGNFTQVNGVTRSRAVAFNTSDGSLDPGFAPVVNGSAYAVALTNTTAYVGGSFSVVNSTAKSRIAAVNLADGAVLPDFTVPVGDRAVRSIVLSPDGSQVVLAGNFTSVGGSSAPGYGIYRADAITGAGKPLGVNDEVRDAGDNSAILRLASDGTSFYGAGYSFKAGAAGNSEGMFQGSWADGSLVNVEDCHGDSYDVAPVGAVVYVASHEHYCGNSGGFPQDSPSQTYRHSTAWTTYTTGTNIPDVYDYPDHPGTPHPGLLTWFPQTAIGSFTGQHQAVWSVTGNDQYVVYGGEFPSVNGTPQQGIVRYAVRSIAPNKQGPRTIDGKVFVPSVKSYRTGEVRVSWSTLWDRDDDALTYQVERQDAAAPLFSRTESTLQWTGRTMQLNLTDQPVGTSQQYRVRVTDPSGNTVTSAWIAVTVAGADGLDSYADTVLDDGATQYWRFDEPAGSATVRDFAGADDTTAGAGVTRGTSGALVGSPDTASTFSGTSAGVAISSHPSLAQQGPDTFSQEVWFRTTAPNGKITGFGDSPTTTSGLYDRHVYLQAGRLYFGVLSDSVRQTIASPAGTSMNDGQWHQVVATLGPAGMVLYVDGVQVATNPAVHTGQFSAGFWRVGGDSTWGTGSGATYLKGDIDEFSLYPTQLSAGQVNAHWVASGRSTTLPAADPTAAFTSSPTGLTVDLDGTTSSDSDGTISSYAWDFGDGHTGTGATPTHTYDAGGDYDVTLTVTDNDHRTGAVSQQVSVTAPPNTPPSAAFTSTVKRLEADFDATTSSDTDGTVASYAWDFGDGSTDTGATPTHTYASDGSYDVTLTVTDDDGATSPPTTHPVSVSGANSPPVAAFSTTLTGLKVDADGITSGDPDGTIVSYAWDFGDGSTDTGATPSHTYSAGGTYDVTLTVTDDDGATSPATTHSVSVSVPNSPPTAAFTSTATGLKVDADATTSTDSDGTVTSYAWGFGDGSTATGPTPSHTYSAGGTYTITLTVTDDDGATSLATTHPVSVVAPNSPPTAAFTSSTSGLTASFTNGSTDKDGTIVSYDWDFGDGTTHGTTASPSHAYGVAKTYQVSLTVTDDHGAISSVTHAVTVTAPVSPAFARDLFRRNVTNGWGTADTGGAWTLTGGNTRFNVSNGVGARMVLPANLSLNADLKGVSRNTTIATAAFSVDKIVDGTYVGVVTRRVGSNYYNVRLRVGTGGTVQMNLLLNSSTLIGTNYVVPGLTVVPGQQYTLKAEATSTSSTTTRVSGKVWKSSNPEPSAWQRTGTNTLAALQAAGSIGLFGKLPATPPAGSVPVTLTWGSLVATTN